MSEFIFTGNEVPSGQKYSQVYQATHVGGGTARLPLMNRSFISFTYGGKHIEDFNLIATIDGARMERSGYSSFNDITSSYDNLDGQQYWNTHYKTNTIDFRLATDGMDQRQLDDFLHWFSAGVCRELVLAEHPNRGQLARVANPPKLHLLPFEQNVNVKIQNSNYATKTTLYKGEIDLSLVMDSPHWYSILNVLGKLNEHGDRFRDVWDVEGENGSKQEISIYASQDALKIIYEDNIPIGGMIQSNMFLGSGIFANVQGQTHSYIWSPQSYDADIVWENGVPSGQGARIDSGNGETGIINGAIIDATGTGIGTLNSGKYGYFYYAGTAPAPTIIRFTLTGHYNEDGYIDIPYNSKTIPKYNTLTIEGTTKQELKFTTPNILTSYNKAIEIFKSATEDWSTEDLVKHLRDEVRHKSVREYAIYIVATLNADNPITAMKGIFNNAAPIIALEFNSENGEAKGKIRYKVHPTSSFPSAEDAIEEDVGDMLRSNYIIIRERNHPTDNGFVTAWKDTNDITKTQSHRIYHDVPNGLQCLMIEYKNMYL